MTEPSFKDHEEPLESSPIVAKSINEVSITNHVNVLEAHNLEDKVTPNLFPFALDLSSIPSEDPEDKLPTCKDLKGKIIEGTENVEQNRVVENFNFSVEAFESDTAEGVVNEEADEIKEIDEELLLELDAVGDFSIKEMGSNWSDIEKHLAADGENLLVPLSEEEIEKPVVVESLHACREFGSSCKDPNLAGTNIVLPVLEARSFEDIDLAFKQLHEGVNVEQLILPSSIDDRQVVAESEDQVKADLDLQIVEARSLEDIHMALMQVSENNSDKLPKPLDFKEKSVELGANEVGSSKEIESSSEESHIQGTSTCAAANPNHEVGETSEDPNLIKNVKNAKLEANEVGSSEEIESSSEESYVQGTSTCAAENSNHEVVETFKDPNLIEKAKSHKSSSGSSDSD
ncbi:hypothetical protein L1049_007887 [Liquidambar formosana]|uniref:Uncharacterized protein n=1 Tax=Liquidambar formosana TaxID=63359 RepID=A0AAP0S2M7_LIQFO